MSSSLGKHTGDSMFRIASIHDRIFFSEICRCLFWDEGFEDNSAKCVAACVESGSNGSLSCIWFQVRLPFHLTWDNMSVGDSQRHCPKVVDISLLERQLGLPWH